MQVVGLSKIAAFCRNDQLYEVRQAEVRKASMVFWAVPDEARRKPVYESARDAAARLLFPNPGQVLAARENILENPASLETHLSSAYDWRLVVMAVGRERSAAERTFILSTGRSRVFLFNLESGSWAKMEDKHRVELPRDTLLYAEVRGFCKDYIEEIDFQEPFFCCRQLANLRVLRASVCLMLYFDQSATNQLANVFLIAGCGFL